MGAGFPLWVGGELLFHGLPQYHRRGGAYLRCSEWEEVRPRAIAATCLSSAFPDGVKTDTRPATHGAPFPWGTRVKLSGH